MKICIVTINNPFLKGQNCLGGFAPEAKSLSTIKENAGITQMVHGVTF